MNRPTKTKFLTIRLTEQERHAFSVKTQPYGGPSFVLRELVNAFSENRVTIKPPVNQPAEGLYK